MSSKKTTDSLCRDCLQYSPPHKKRCVFCGSARLLSHPEKENLTIAHMDCDAFFAAIEKRDRPELHKTPLIIGGGKRGVVSTCCYIARTFGVHSAMPMYRAKKLCPDATIIAPGLGKYSEVGGIVKKMMETLTPAVQPISIDEAFLDLSGTERLHGCSPVKSLAKLVLDIERELGITISVGLSYNKYLAKVASDQNKPKGFTIIGKHDVMEFLRPKPVSLIWGVGKVLNKKLNKNGIVKIGQLQTLDKNYLIKNYGTMGSRLYHFSRGEDLREVKKETVRKSISNEHTFNEDIKDQLSLESYLWLLAEKVSFSLKKKEQSGKTITLKLKPSIHKTITRATTLEAPTQMTHVIFNAASQLLKNELNGTPYRLIGVSISKLSNANEADLPDLLKSDKLKMDSSEKALDNIRSRFGKSSIIKGRALPPRQK